MVYTTKIIEIKQETHDTKSFKFEKPIDFKYKAGQYGIFEHKLADSLIRRSYSFSSSPTEDFLQITVKLMDKGKMSGYLHGLKKDDELTYNAPIGKFIFEDNLKNVGFIAGGSGISPFRGMIKYILDKKLATKITLIYGSRTPHDTIMLNELNEFHQTHPDFRLYLTVDHTDETWHFHSGFIDAEFIKEATNNDFKDKVFFLIGPPIMVTSVKKALLSLEVDSANIRVDAWG